MSKKPLWRGLFEPLEARILLSGDRLWSPDAAPLGDLPIDPPTAIVAPQRAVVSRSFGPPAAGVIPPAGGTDAADAATGPVVAVSDPVDPVAKPAVVPRALPKVSRALPKPAVVPPALRKPALVRVAVDRVSLAAVDPPADKERPAVDRPAGVTPIRLVTEIKPRTIVSSMATLHRPVRPTVVKTLPEKSVRNVDFRADDAVKTIRRRLAVVVDKASPQIKAASLPRVSEPPRTGADAAVAPQTKSHPTPLDVQTAVTSQPALGSESLALWWLPDATPPDGDLAAGDEVETAVYDQGPPPAVPAPAWAPLVAADRRASEWSSRSVRGVNRAAAAADEESLLAQPMETALDAADIAVTEEEPNDALTTQTAGALLAVTFGNPLTRLISAAGGGQEPGPDAPLTLAPIPPTPSRRRRRARGGKRQATEETTDEATAAAEATAEETPDPPKLSSISPRSADVAFGILGQRLIGSGKIRQAGEPGAELATWNGAAWQLGVASLLGSIGWLALARCRSGQASRKPTWPTQLVCTGPTHDGPLAVG